MYCRAYGFTLIWIGAWQIGTFIARWCGSWMVWKSEYVAVWIRLKQGIQHQKRNGKIQKGSARHF